MIDFWVERLHGSEQGDMLTSLSDSERKRAARMRSSLTRARYVIAHNWLHSRLGEILDLAPANVPIVWDERGAPSIAGGGPHISFSHHRDVVGLAVSTDVSVGTDVLEIPDDARFLADTALVLSPSEIAFVRSAPSHLQGVAFAHCWTRKEAYAKCRRSGLTRDLPTITLTPCTTKPQGATLWSRELPRVVVAVATAAPGSPDVRLRGSSETHRNLRPDSDDRTATVGSRVSAGQRWCGGESACTPDFVPGLRPAAAIPLGRRLPDGSSGLPGGLRTGSPPPV